MASDMALASGRVEYEDFEIVTFRASSIPDLTLLDWNVQPTIKMVHFYLDGLLISIGKNCIVQSVGKFILKTAIPVPLNQLRTESKRRRLEHEARVYAFLGPNPFIPSVISWNPDPSVLVLENINRGNLEAYVKDRRQLTPSIRRRWVPSVVEAVAALHRDGVTHNLIRPSHFLVSKDLTLRICGFAYSSIADDHCVGHAGPGARYQRGERGPSYVPVPADDLFGLGSVIYFIMTGREPYHQMSEKEVQQTFQRRNFPPTEHLEFSDVIQGCWRGEWANAAKVFELADLLASLYAAVDGI